MPEVRHINLYPESNMIFLALVSIYTVLWSSGCTQRKSDLHVSWLLSGNTRAFSGHSTQYNKWRHLKRRGERVRAMPSLVDNFCGRKSICIRNTDVISVLHNFHFFRVLEMWRFLLLVFRFYVQCHSQVLGCVLGCCCRHGITVSANDHKVTD